MAQLTTWSQQEKTILCGDLRWELLELRQSRFVAIVFKMVDVDPARPPGRAGSPKI
ncbi:hypothetical protein EGR_08612 [Echinococcus granulosus]|uniref:Uncharacterized protein n=1 Tax=Echinococcus granulosus TaxID=6210 RepID=W6UT29_ECHGR|nr:hypothetical protein EGR_08612 [Echinococcus granulosus]EUB56539.1 hypothetical protein EGR_08612 [Echinococcus granulosus]